MTKIIFTLLISALVATTSMGQAAKSIDLSKSSVTWTGSKVTGSHTGTIDISEGSLEFNNGRLSGGSFTIDMTSIANTDLGDKMKGRLEGHLKSDDFFSVETYPEATLVITSVAPGKGGLKLTGDLTIKGKSAPVTFEASVKGSMATANITVDRTVYDVKYGSGKFFDNLGDKMISDDFDLVVNLSF